MKRNIKNIVMSFGLSVLLLFTMSPNMAWAGDESTDNIQQYVVYSKDLTTGVEEYETLSFNPDEMCEDTQGYVPVGDEMISNTECDVSPNSVIGSDTRQEIMKTSDFPYKAICKLVAIWRDKPGTGTEGHERNGTGFMINRNYMLTAGHIIYDSIWGYCDELLVYPARNRIYAPYGPYKAIKMTVTNEYKEKPGSGDEDWGLVKLNDTVGDITGYFGLNISTNTTDLLSKKISVTGYPGDKSDEYLGMWKGSGTVKSQSSTTIGYDCDTFGGDSGAPVYDSSNTVVAIHVRGTGQYSQYNEGTKINSKVKGIINLLTM